MSVFCFAKCPEELIEGFDDRKGRLDGLEMTFGVLLQHGDGIFCSVGR